MARPVDRRTGFSRKAQYRTFIAYIVGVVGAAIGAVLLVFGAFEHRAFAALRSTAADVTAPAGTAVAGARSESIDVFSAIAGYFAAGRQNARLRREVELARVKLAEANAIAEENQRLKALLRLGEVNGAPVATARMIASTATSTRRFATVSAGSDDGVTIGMPVRSPMGLVGRVLEAGAQTSRVLLVTDTESIVPVRRARDGLPAFASGQGDGTLVIKLISLGINPLKRGDAIVSSGSGGLYRPGTPLAVVTKLTRDGAVARVLSDPSATEFVVIEPIWNPAPPPPQREQIPGEAAAP
jgi:rod shape-determining protein MreC